MLSQQTPNTKVHAPYSLAFFVPIAVETLGVLGREARHFVKEVARRVKSVTDDPLAHQYLLQRISVAVQRGNAAALLGCMGVRDGG